MKEQSIYFRSIKPELNGTYYFTRLSAIMVVVLEQRLDLSSKMSMTPRRIKSGTFAPNINIIANMQSIIVILRTLLFFANNLLLIKCHRKISLLSKIITKIITYSTDWFRFNSSCQY